MSKPYLLGLLAVAAALAVTLATALHLLRPVRITQAACDRIQHGMTQRQVEAILGGPPGDFRTRQSGVMIVVGPSRSMQEVDPSVEDGAGVPRREGRQETWCGDEGSLTIGFDLDHTVLWKEFTLGGDVGWVSGSGVLPRQSSFSRWWRRWWDRLAP